MFRGFLLALLSGSVGLLPAVLVTITLFGVYHINQGRAAAIKSGAAGLVFTLIAIGSGSLLPGILIHVVQDLVAGDLYYRVSGGARIDQPATGLTAGCASVM